MPWWLKQSARPSARYARRWTFRAPTRLSARGGGGSVRLPLPKRAGLEQDSRLRCRDESVDVGGHRGEDVRRYVGLLVVAWHGQELAARVHSEGMRPDSGLHWVERALQNHDALAAVVVGEGAVGQGSHIQLSTICGSSPSALAMQAAHGCARRIAMRASARVSTTATGAATGCGSRLAADTSNLRTTKRPG